MLSYCQSDSQCLLLAAVSSLPFRSSSSCEIRNSCEHDFVQWAPALTSWFAFVFCLILCFPFIRTSTPPQKSFFSFTRILFCVCLSTRLLVSSERPQVLPNGWLPVQREVDGCSLLLLIPSLFQLLEISPSYTGHLFSFLPPNHTLSSFYFKQRRRYLSQSLFSSALVFSPHSSVFLSLSISFLAAAQLLVCGLTAPLITLHTLCRRKTAKLISRANWQPETEMRSSRLSCTDGVTRQIPGFFCGCVIRVALHSGLEQCLDEADLRGSIALTFPIY